MSLELVREAVKISEVVNQDLTQTVVENDIIVPDVKPDVGRILLLDGDVLVNNSEIMQEKIQVNGTVRYKILYLCEDESQCTKSINTNANFTCDLRVQNAKPGMRSLVKCDIEHIEYSVLNGRKINVKTIIKVEGKVTDDIEHEVIGDLRGIDDIQVLKDNITLNSFIGCNKVSFEVKEGLEVPAGKPTIREILRNDVKITGKDYKITEGKVVVKGELGVSTLYVSDDETRNFQSMEHEIPFTHFVDLDGVNENSLCEVDYQISDYQFDAVEDSDGELRILSGGVVLDIEVTGYEKKNVQIVADAYSPLARLEIDKEPFRVEEAVLENRSQIILKDTITINSDSPDIAEVFNVLCKPGITECRVYEDKVTIEGLVNNNVLYLANNTEQPIYCHEQEIPFRHNIDVKGICSDMKCDVNLDIEHYNYSVVSSSEVEVRLVIGVEIRAINQNSIPLIVKVSEHPFEDSKRSSQPSLIIYYSQQGDNLWKIAKKYYTTIEDIKKVNSINDKDLTVPGQQILIPRKVV